MRRVSDDSGTCYGLLKRSTSASLVRDLETGTVTYVPNSELEPADHEADPDESDGGTAETSFDPALEVLLALHEDEPVAVRTLLEQTSLCESDLHGVLADLQAGDRIEQVAIGQERGYALTERGRTLAVDAEAAI